MLAFAALKSAMRSTAALRIPNTEQAFIWETDARTVARGAVLRQGDNGDRFPVDVFSIGFSKHEGTYSTYE